jgi:hypothetical protein
MDCSIDRDPIALESRPDLWAKAIDFTEVHWAAEGIFQEKTRLLHADEGKRAAVLDLYAEVYVTILPIVAAGEGTEHREVAYPLAPEFLFLCRKLYPHSIESAGRHIPCPGSPQGGLNIGFIMPGCQNGISTMGDTGLVWPHPRVNIGTRWETGVPGREQLNEIRDMWHESGLAMDLNED